MNLVEYPDFEMPELSNNKKESKTTYSFPESYVDPMSNTSFIPPRGWRSIDKSKEGKYTGVMFVSDRNSSTLIGYSCVDFWDAIDESERSILELLGISRKDIDNTYITKDIIANSYGCSPEDVGSQFYANQEFYVIKTTTTSSVFHGYDVSAPTTMFVCVNNGYQYSFFYASFKESSSSSWFTVPTTEFDYMMNSLSFGQNEYPKLDISKVYYVPGEDTYHSVKSCDTLVNKKTLYMSSLDFAVSQKLGPCRKCVDPNQIP